MGYFLVIGQLLVKILVRNLTYWAPVFDQNLVNFRLKKIIIF